MSLTEKQRALIKEGKLRPLVEPGRPLIWESPEQRKARLREIIRRYEAGDSGRDARGNKLTAEYYGSAINDLALAERVEEYREKGLMGRLGPAPRESKIKVRFQDPVMQQHYETNIRKYNMSWQQAEAETIKRFKEYDG